MTPPEGKKSGGIPPQDLTRLAQRDIGKVARLFRDSGFRYRVFDSETGEHQIVDPVRPLPPMDHVPPVWPPPLSEEESLPRPAVRRPAAAPVAAEAVRPLREVAPPVAPAKVPPPVVPEPKTSPAALRAEAKTDEIFRAAALGQMSAAHVVQPAPMPPPVAREQENPMSTSRTTSASTARQVARLVSIPGNQEPKAAPATAQAPAAAGARPFRGGGPSVGAVFDKLMQPPAPPPRPAPSSTAAVLRGLVAPRGATK